MKNLTMTIAMTLVCGLVVLSGCHPRSADTGPNSTGSNGSVPDAFSLCQDISPANNYDELIDEMNTAKLCQPVSAYCPPENQIVGTEKVYRMYEDLFESGPDGPPWSEADIVQAEDTLHDDARAACTDVGKSLYGVSYHLNDKTGYPSFEATCSSCVEKTQCGEPGQWC